MRKCIRTAAALLLALALAAGLFGCSKLTPIVSGGDKPHTTEPAATGSQTDTEDTQNMENAEDTGEQDWAGEEESSDPAPVETDPPVWEGPETVVYLAPYDALAVEYGGYFYYVDRDDNLCRTTTDMTDYTLFCEAQIRGDVRIIGITDAGRMYLSSGGQSCYVDLAEGRDGMAADYGMVESQTFTGAALSIGIRALRGGWMYYTKSGENGLFRAKIGAVPEEENCIVFDKDIREAAVTGDYLIYTYNRGSRADLQVTLADDPDSLLLTIEGNGTYPTTMLAGTDDRNGTPPCCSFRAMSSSTAAPNTPSMTFRRSSSRRTVCWTAPSCRVSAIASAKRGTRSSASTTASVLIPSGHSPTAATNTIRMPTIRTTISSASSASPMPETAGTSSRTRIRAARPMPFRQQAQSSSRSSDP